MGTEEIPEIMSSVLFIRRLRTVILQVDHVFHYVIGECKSLLSYVTSASFLQLSISTFEHMSMFGRNYDCTSTMKRRIAFEKILTLHSLTLLHSCRHSTALLINQSCKTFMRVASATQFNFKVWKSTLAASVLRSFASSVLIYFEYEKTWT